MRLSKLVREELVVLWSDLTIARRNAYPADGWSIQALGLAARIVGLSRAVGATPWWNIDIITLTDGTYQKVYDEAGITYPTIDWDRVREVKAYIDRTVRA